MSTIKSRKLEPGELMPKIPANRSRWMSSPKESVILKILIIGDPCVGKTSYVQRYVNGTFHRNYKGTIGGEEKVVFEGNISAISVDFALKIIKWDDDATVKVQLWDIAGQERYTSMTRVYYRDAHACIVMFDLTNRNSFLNVVKWKRDFDSKCVHSDGAPIPCLLVANKSDAESLRQVADEEIERLCTEFNFNAWTEMSVKDNLMVDDSMKQASFTCHAKANFLQIHRFVRFAPRAAYLQHAEAASRQCEVVAKFCQCQNCLQLLMVPARGFRSHQRFQ